MPKPTYYWDFRKSLVDEVNNHVASAYGSYSKTADGIRLHGTNGEYISLGSNLLNTDERGLTISVVSARHSSKFWSRCFDFGSGTSNYIMMSWNESNNNKQISSLKFNGTEWNSNYGMSPGSINYVDDTFIRFTATVSNDNEGNWYAEYYLHGLGGQLLSYVRCDCSNKWSNWRLSDYSFPFMYLGKSLYSADSYTDATYRSAALYDVSLAAEQISTL